MQVSACVRTLDNPHTLEACVRSLMEQPWIGDIPVCCSGRLTPDLRGLLMAGDNTGPSLLGRLFRHYGTDKDRNGYTPFYERIVEDPKAVQSVLEVGVGTLQVGAPSSMIGWHLDGYTPGGSLRAWRAWMPQALIEGVDPQDDCQIAEDRIVVHKADSRAFHTSNLYDLVIDDGLHEASCQFETLRNLWASVRPGGHYVIEDIAEKDLFFGVLWSEILQVVGDAGTWVSPLKNFVVFSKQPGIDPAASIIRKLAAEDSRVSLHWYPWYVTPPREAVELADDDPRGIWNFFQWSMDCCAYPRVLKVDGDQVLLREGGEYLAKHLDRDYLGLCCWELTGPHSRTADFTGEEPRYWNRDIGVKFCRIPGRGYERIWNLAWGDDLMTWGPRFTTLGPDHPIFLHYGHLTSADPSRPGRRLPQVEYTHGHRPEVELAGVFPAAPDRCDTVPAIVARVADAYRPQVQKFRFHLPSLPNYPVNQNNTACAYSQKVLKFIRMMTKRGHECIHYGLEGSDVPCEHVTTMTLAEQEKHWAGHDYHKEYSPILWDASLPYWRDTNLRAAVFIRDNYKPKDILGIIGGCCQKPIMDMLAGDCPHLFTIEYGIGYYGTFAKYRCFESYSHMHHVYGHQNTDNGNFYDCVIPNYFDAADFPFVAEPDDYYLFMGRIIQRKGLEVAVEATRRIGAKLKIAGQGVVNVKGNKIYARDGSVYTGDHLEYVGFADAQQRAELMGRARAVFVPTFYIEPFGGVGVEAMMCFPGDVPVKAKSIERLYSHTYTGALLRLRTEHHSIECTTEHPFMTQRGWVKARDLTEHDLLVRRRIPDEQERMDGERIGNLVTRLSDSGTFRLSEDSGSRRWFYQVQGPETWVAPSQPEVLRGVRERDHQKVLSEIRRRLRGQQAWPETGERYQEGGFTRSVLRTGLGALHERTGGNAATGVCVHWCRSISDETEPHASVDSRESAENGFSSSIRRQDQPLSCHDEPTRIGLSSRAYRRRRYCISEESWQEEPSTLCSSHQYVRGNDRLDQGENPDTECNNPETLQQRKRIRQGIYTAGVEHLLQRTLLPSFVQGVDTVSNRQTSTDGNDRRVDLNSAIAAAERRAYRESAHAWADDPVYEFTRIKAITTREVTNLPVFNLGTRSGTYEANGFLVHNCGTPAITTDFGAFTEIVQHGKTGFRCHTLAEFAWAADAARHLDRQYIRNYATSNYGFERISAMYEYYFAMVLGLHNAENDWYGKKPVDNLDWLQRKVIDDQPTPNLPDLQRPGIHRVEVPGAAA